MAHFFTYTQFPCGASPTQACGYINETGQSFAFRYRGGEASLVIYVDGGVHYCKSGPQVAASFVQRERRANRFGALPTPVVTHLIANWLGSYLRTRG